MAMVLGRVRVETYEKGLVNDLLDLYKALQEEPESCQWLRLWPDYERLLKKTLEDLVDDRMYLRYIFFPDADLVSV